MAAGFRARVPALCWDEGRWILESDAGYADGFDITLVGFTSGDARMRLIAPCRFIFRLFCHFAANPPFFTGAKQTLEAR